MGRHQLAVKLEGEPHLSTTLPKVQWKGRADLVGNFGQPEGWPQKNYLNTNLDWLSLISAEIGSVKRMQQASPYNQVQCVQFCGSSFLHASREPFFTALHALATTKIRHTDMITVPSQITNS